MNIRFLMIVMIFLAVLLTYTPNSLSQESDTDVLDIIPKDDAMEPVANVDAQYKFDGGFFDKVRGLVNEVSQDGDFGVYDGIRYYSVIIVVTRDDGDNRDPDEVAKENKDAIIERLELIGARDIVAAESLSFVTASIPVADIPGFSLYEEVYRLGDGEIPIEFAVNTARTTIHATTNDLIRSTGKLVDGTGITVAIVDSGINNVAVNDRVIDRVVCDNQGCDIATINDVMGYERLTIEPNPRSWMEPDVAIVWNKQVRVEQK